MCVLIVLYLLGGCMLSFMIDKRPRVEREPVFCVLLLIFL